MGSKHYYNKTWKEMQIYNINNALDLVRYILWQRCQTSMSLHSYKVYKQKIKN